MESMTNLRHYITGMHVCVYIYICNRVYISMHACTCGVCMCVCMSVYIYIYIDARRLPHIYIYMYVYIIYI